MAKYPYTILPTSDGDKVYKPFIPARLAYKKTHKITFGINALIDSGADVCFCAMDISLWLGINLSKKRRFDFTAANNQTFDTYKEVVTMYVAGKKYDTPFYFSDKLTKNFPLILGQKGFFDHFKVCFDLKNKIMDIS